MKKALEFVEGFCQVMPSSSWNEGQRVGEGVLLWIER